VSETIFPVLAANESAVVGGSEVQQRIVAHALRKRGYRVSVLTGDHDVPDSVTTDGIEIFHVPPAGRRGIRGLRRIHPRMTDVVRRLRDISPDVVYFRGANGVLGACAWFARRVGKKAIFASASDADFYPGRIFGIERRELLLYRTALRFCDLIVVQNSAQKAMLLQRFGRAGVIVPNCYTEDDFAIGKPTGPIVWIGQVDRNKRPELFIDLASRHPDRQFVMVGGARRQDDVSVDYYRAVEARARQLGNLQFAGFVPFREVGRFYDGASALVNTSVLEGFPNTFLQAWIRGIPTLSFVAPTTSDEDAGTIACRDADDLDLKLSALLRDADRWRAAAERARRHFHTHHSLDAVMPIYERLLCP